KWTSILNGGQRVDKTEQAIKDNKPLFGNIRDKHNLVYEGKTQPRNMRDNMLAD
ncbi:14208_t:CDS:1, partial [Rhizophagus irregularis]